MRSDPRRRGGRPLTSPACARAGLEIAPGRPLVLGPGKGRVGDHDGWKRHGLGPLVSEDFTVPPGRSAARFSDYV
jgi:hypothetical protein